MGRGMGVSMVAMMVPTAVPFFLAHGRDTRQPVAIATVVLIYLAVWAAIGLALDYLMSQVMMPSSLLIVGIAIVIALMYPRGAGGCVSTAARWPYASHAARGSAMPWPRGRTMRCAV